MITMMPPSEIPAIPPRCSGVVVRSMRFSFDCASCSYLRCSLGVPADEVRKRAGGMDLGSAHFVA